LPGEFFKVIRHNDPGPSGLLSRQFAFCDQRKYPLAGYSKTVGSLLSGNQVHILSPATDEYYYISTTLY
jgi:hypothetical protein